MKKITVRNRFRDYIEALHYEKKSRLDLIVFMLNTDMKNTSMFDKIIKEYTEYFISYELAKQELKKTYIKPHSKTYNRWELDFKTCEVKIYE